MMNKQCADGRFQLFWYHLPSNDVDLCVMATVIDNEVWFRISDVLRILRWILRVPVSDVADPSQCRMLYDNAERPTPCTSTHGLRLLLAQYHSPGVVAFSDWVHAKIEAALLPDSAVFEP